MASGSGLSESQAMESESKVACCRCGDLILLATADECYKHCRPCYQELLRSTDPFWTSFHAEPKVALPFQPGEVLVVVRFFPGFCEDLTKWDTWILNDGRVVQVIDWYEPFHCRTKESLRRGVIEPSDLAEIDQLLLGWDEIETDIRTLTDQCAITDAASISVRSAKYNVNSSLMLFAYETLSRRDLSSLLAARGLKAFRRLWDLADGASPYSTKLHFGRL